MASAVSTVTGQTVQVVVYDSSLTEEAVAPAGATPPTLDSAVLQGVVNRGTRSVAQQITTDSGDQLVVGLSRRRRDRRLWGGAALGLDDADHQRAARRDPAHHGGRSRGPGTGARARRAAHRPHAAPDAPTHRHGRATRRRRSHRAKPADTKPRRGGSAREQLRPHGRSHRGGLPSATGFRGAGAPVHRRCVARAPHPAYGAQGLHRRAAQGRWSRAGRRSTRRSRR